jgi:ribosomal protein S18 acetylase RimI-like enzyme
VTLALRPLTAEDGEAMAKIVGDYDAVLGGAKDRPSADDMLDWWRRIDIGSIGVVDEAENGRLIGLGYLRGRGPFAIADYYVHPEARGRGAGSVLVDWGERRTGEAGLGAVRPATTANDNEGKELLESRGYRYIRSFYRMAVDLVEPPPAPVWPEGFIAALEPDEARVLYETLEEAFEDHWGHEPRRFEEWMKQNAPLDERLCYIVRAEDGTPAAAQVCDEERFGSAWVSILGVRSPWRRRGLGEALLQQAFHDLYARGRRRVSLGVDAENTTGATRLYERVGMTVTLQDDAYEKVLEPARAGGGTKLG